MCFEGINSGNELVLDLSTNDVNQCTNGSRTDVSPGNNSASRTAFYHGNWLKQTWRSKIRTHSRPFDLQDNNFSICPQSSDASQFLNWLTSSTKIKVNFHDCQYQCGGFFKQGCYKHEMEFENLVCLADDVDIDSTGAHWGNVAQYPDILYHELGHAIDDHDGICIWPGVDNPTCSDDSESSSEAYADIVTTLLTRSSCIGRGVTDQECENDSWDPCDSCAGGLRDINYLNHSSGMRYTPNWIEANDDNNNPALPDYCDPGSITPGPCGLNPYCEGQVATQAFWDLKNELANSFGPNQAVGEATAWELVDLLFSKSIYQLGPNFYRCDTGISDSDGCLPQHLLWSFIIADDNDGNLCNGSPHIDQIRDSLNFHEIGFNPLKSSCNPLDDNGDPICSYTGGPLCPELNSPLVVINNVGNNVIQLEWDPVPGAQSYKIMKNPFGPDLGNELAGIALGPDASGKVTFIDGNVGNGQPYYYHVLPVAGSSSCIGKSSQSVSATPGGTLFILPDLSSENNEILWVQNKYKSVTFKAYGGFGEYTYSLAGSLPSGLTLDENTGILSGTPSFAGTSTVTIIAVDNHDPVLLGQRQYVINVLSGLTGNLGMATYLEPAVLGAEYDFNLLTEGGVNGFRLEIVEGNLPDGLYITTPGSPGEYHIQGIPTLDSLGLYSVTLAFSAKNNLGIRVILERTLYLSVLNRGHLGQESLMVSPEVGSTVGGNQLTLLYKSLTSRVPDLHRLQFVSVPESDQPEQPTCEDSEAYIEYTGELSFTELHAETGNYQYLIEAGTSPLPEGEYYVRLKRPASGETVCADNTFSARPYGIVSNRRDHTLSILDTYTQNLLSTTPTVALDSSFGPAGLDFSKGTAMARYLFLTDQNSGDAGVVDMGTLSFLGMIDAQEGGYRYKDSDIAIDPSNDFAYVTHLTMGYPGGVHEPPDPISGGVTVLDLTGESCNEGESWCPYDADVDPEPSTDSPGAPVGITRLYTETDLLLPLNIEILDLGRPTFDQYSEGEKYPGYYAFISGVGEIAVNCLDAECEKYELLPRPARLGILDLNPQQCQKVGNDPCGELIDNSDYWKFSKKILGPITLSNDAGSGLGNINQGLSFAVDKTSNPPQATVYAVNQEENRIYMIDYVYNPDTLSTDWVLRDTYLVTGNKPSDVSINTINDNGVTRTLAYVTNIEDGTVSAIDTATGGQAYPDLVLPLRTQSYYAAPTALDTHVKDGAGYGYTANTDDDTVTVFNLVGNTFVRNLAVGDYPLRIKIQPDVDAALVFTTVLTTLSYASPTDFTTPSKQPSLIRDWERVHELQETSSNSTAVLSNIDNFQNSVDKWITDEEVKAEVTQGIQLYRTVYLMNLP